MADDNSTWQWALHVVKSGMSANEGLRQLRQMGGQRGRSEWLATVRAAQGQIEANAKATTLRGDRRPYQREILAMSTTVQAGYLQHVDVWVRDRETGDVYARPYSIRTDDLLTHADTIATALDRYRDSAKFYDQDILGATYGATYLLAPKGR